MIRRALRAQYKWYRAPSWPPVSSNPKVPVRLLTERVEHYKQIDANDREDAVTAQCVTILDRVNGLVDTDVEHGKRLAHRPNE